MAHIKKTILSAVIIIFVFFAHPVFCISQITESQVDAKLQQVSLFKNGLGFFTSQITCPANKETFSFVPAAAPCHGTFWLSNPVQVHLENLTVEKVETEKATEAVTIEELLRANTGKTVSISFDDKGESTIVGVIKSFAQNRRTQLPAPYNLESIDYSRNRTGRGYSGNIYTSNFMMMETDTGTVVVNPQTVRRIDFIKDEPNKTFTSKVKSVRVKVKIAKPADGQKLQISYLGKGITWAPSYVIDITDDDNAVLSAKALIINEVCDLNNVKIQLITGFPHLQFSDVVSPLAMKENLSQFLNSLNRGQSERVAAVASNVMSQSVRFDESPFPGSTMPAYGASKAGKASEDLFFYPIESVSLSKSATGYVPLFTESVPYSHIYRWQIPDNLDSQNRYQNNRQATEKKEEVVWHCLRLKNTTKVPWTTAPAEITKDDLILGQDTLNYTPMSTKATVRITRAISVKAEQLELETDRKRDALRSYGYHYDLITIDGKLSATNFLDKAVELEITKTLSGEVKTSEPEAEIEKLAHGLRSMNGIKKLTWTIKLDSGQSRQLSYIYEVYVRR